MNRIVTDCNTEVSLVNPFKPADLRQWIEDICEREKLSRVLVHLLGAVVWGTFENRMLQLKEGPTASMSGAFPNTETLSVENLLQLRLFSSSSELFCWKHSAEELRGRIIRDNASVSNPRWQLCVDEEHLVWGTQFKQHEGFLVLTEGGRELQQRIPSLNPPSITKRISLRVRQYLETCPTSGQYIARCGRMVELVGGG